MGRLVSVEAGLDDVKAHLDSCGYQVLGMEEAIRPVEAIIYKGLSENNRQMGRTGRGTAVINANGLTGEQVVACLDDLL